MASNWPLPLEAPADADLGRCVHCGLCLTSCPTYLVTGLEVESPRGRIHMAKLVNEGRSELTQTIQQHWDLCLQCRACEAVCPSGVPYGRIQEHARAQVQKAPPSGGFGRRMRRFALRNVVARQRVLGALMAPARWYAGSKLRKVVRLTRLLRLSSRVRAAERSLPRKIGAPFRAGATLAEEDGRPRVAMLTGCVMGELFGDVHRATERVLNRAGYAVDAPNAQGCCGALHAHDGDLEFARKLARKNIDAFAGAETIVVNSAGCGAAMKEYGDLLSRDDRYAGRAAAFSSRVRDLSEFLAGVERPSGRAKARVSYQDACHLVHAQRIREQPRQLLAEIAGCELVETPGADVCCGAAGLYSLVQPGMSAELRRMKADQFAAAKPDVVVTGNPGCQLQYTAAVEEAGISARVMHLAEFLNEAQANAER